MLYEPSSPPPTARAPRYHFQEANLPLIVEVQQLQQRGLCNNDALANCLHKAELAAIQTVA
jgi:hypothetical protein